MDSFKRLIITKNLFDIPLMIGYPSSTAGDITTKRTWTTGRYVVGFNPTNYFYAGAVSSFDITKTSIAVSSTGHYGIAIAFELTANKKYTISCNVGGTLGRLGITSFAEDGTASYMYASDYSATTTYTFTVPASSRWIVFSFIAQPNTGIATFSNIQLEEGEVKTDYAPHSYRSYKSVTYAKNTDGTLKKIVSYKKKIVTDLPAIQKVSERANYPVKSQFTTTRGADTLTWDVLDYDKHTLLNSTSGKSMCVGMHDVMTYGTIPFCAPQLMYWSENGLPAGTYKLTLDHAQYGGGTLYDGTYMFTLTKAIPADGGFRHTKPVGGWQSSYAKTDILGNYITTYGARPQRSAIESGVTFSEYDGTTECTDLGTFTARSRTYYAEDDTVNGGKRNFTERQAYGSNRWRDSVYRQWLNSTAPAGTTGNGVSNWWTPQSVFDRAPGGANSAGFLYGLDPSFVATMGKVKVITALCDCDKVDGATQDITYDKVWLQSMTEVFGNTNNSISEGVRLAYWNGSTDADRIKYHNGTARYWWLRSPYPASACHVRDVSSSGGLYSHDPRFANGVVPACCIMQY